MLLLSAMDTLSTKMVVTIFFFKNKHGYVSQFLLSMRMHLDSDTHIFFLSTDLQSCSTFRTLFIKSNELLIFTSLLGNI